MKDDTNVKIYLSWHETMKSALTPEQYIVCMEAMLNYAATGVMKETGNPLIDAITGMCRHNLDEEIKRSKNGRKGGRPKKGDAA